VAASAYRIAAAVNSSPPQQLLLTASDNRHSLEWRQPDHQFQEPEIMTVELTSAELAALERGATVPVTAPGLNVECVLVRADLVDRFQRLATDESKIDALYPLLAELSPEDWPPPMGSVEVDLVSKRRWI
jgi:hypothetical protein